MHGIEYATRRFRPTCVALGFRLSGPTWVALQPTLVISSYECFWIEDHDVILAV